MDQSKANLRFVIAASLVAGGFDLWRAWVAFEGYLWWSTFFHMGMTLSMWAIAMQPEFVFKRAFASTNLKPEHRLKGMARAFAIVGVALALIGGVLRLSGNVT